MPTKPDSPVPITEKNFARDMKTFERQSAKTKDLAGLKERLEKSSGPERADLAAKIGTKAKSG